MQEKILENAASFLSRWEGLKERVISAAVMAAVFLVALFQGGWLFTLLVVAAAILMIREWDGLVATEQPWWKIAGIFYVAIPCASLIWLRNQQFAEHAHGGTHVVLFIILVVCATDIGAYFTGRRVGGAKLAPSISPNKTWAGLGGGVVCAAFAGAVGAAFSPYPPSPFAGIDLGIVLALISQAGDLFESWLKRRVGAKDSGTLIPGHGGLLDRVDGLIFALPIFALFVHFTL